MDALSQMLRAHAYNNAWANHRLLKACGLLSQAEFEAERTSFFPSIRATLNHNLTVDWYYIDAMQRSLAGQPPNPAFASFYDPEVPYATCAELRVEQSASDARLIALCGGLDEPTLRLIVDVPRRTGIDRETLPRLLFHLFEHQVHHRGQAHAMLAGTSVAPPQLDEFFCAGDALRRADDFTELGFSEAAIWPRGARPE